jgi:D-serine deaminase-like pyridoxal phosphate-dependent protein
VVVPDGTPLPPIGSRIQIIPNHICVCVNLQDNFWLWDGSTAHSIPVDARGKLL